MRARPRRRESVRRTFEVARGGRENLLRDIPAGGSRVARVHGRGGNWSRRSKRSFSWWLLLLVLLLLWLVCSGGVGREGKGSRLMKAKVLSAAGRCIYWWSCVIR